MKSLQDNTSPDALTMLTQILGWSQDLSLLHAGLKRHFARPEPFARALRFLQALLSTTERKNCWQVAEHASEATPYGMQRLLSQAVWDANGVRDELRTLALEHLGSQHVTIALDESGFLKRGTQSAGVGMQHYGPTGDLRNCQVGVFLSLVTQRGHCLIDRELYLPADWIADPDRCRDAGIPVTQPFLTKPQLGLLMLQRLQRSPLSIAWVVADSVYGNPPELRTWLESQQQSYVLGIACTTALVLEVPSVGVRRLQASELPALLPASQWQTLSASVGSKGPRLFDWVCLPIQHPGTHDGFHRLLIRRTLGQNPILAFFLVFAPPATSLDAIVTALGARWCIEEDAGEQQRSGSGSLRGA